MVASSWGTCRQSSSIACLPAKMTSGALPVDSIPPLRALAIMWLSRLSSASTQTASSAPIAMAVRRASVSRPPPTRTAVTKLPAWAALHSSACSTANSS